MNVWELSQFPFQMSSYLRAGEQRQSQRPLFHRCSFGKRREGGGTSAAIYGSAGIPPRDRAAHLYSPHVRLIPQEKLTGWWARRERGGGRRAGERKSPPPSCERRWSSSSSPPSYATDFFVTTTVFSFYTHVHMNEHTLVRRDVHSQMLLARSLFKNKDGNISCANTRHMKECLHVRDTRMCCMSSRAVCMCMWMCMWMCEHHIAS